MPDLVKRVVSRASARWQYLTFDTSRTWAVPGAAAGKRDCPNLEQPGHKVGTASPPFQHLDLPWRIGKVGRRVEFAASRRLGAHVHEVRPISRSTSGPRPDCPMAQPGIWEFGAPRWP